MLSIGPESRNRDIDHVGLAHGLSCHDTQRQGALHRLGQLLELPVNGGGGGGGGYYFGRL